MSSLHAPALRTLVWLASLLAAAGGYAASAPVPGGARAVFAQSIATVAPIATGQSARPYISRTALQAGETAAIMPFEVALTMRNFDELEARLAHSEIISPDEMAARYLPLAADHDRVLRWLKAEGMEVTRTDANHLAIFARASVAEVARVFQTTFARVTADGAEFTSAISAPSVPASLAPAVRGIHGLQPHQRLRQRPHPQLRPLAGTGNSLPYYPAQIKQAYNAASLTQTGAGQTIAIYALGFPKATDLTTFWTTTGVAASLTNIQQVNVAGGPATNTSAGSLQEATLDVQWASALAPGATIRIYAASETDPVGDDELIQQILADLPTQPTLHQLSISFGLDENAADRDYIAIEAQYMANLVSAGVTVFAASGDNGALDNELATVQTGFPASMPDVTAVGGTTLTLDPSGNLATEIAWGNLANKGTSGGSGGGVSVIFNRPSWQQNISGAPAGTMRLVPDVASVGDPSTGGLLVYNGRSSTIGGTSLASPTWAAWCALINQSRANSGKPPLGALNPRIYPLAGTAAFRDITSGGNSVFQAGPGYDLTTGIGVPNVAALLQATTTDTFAPVIEVQSGNRFATTGQSATFYVIATSNPTPTYLWQRLAAGTSTWTTLTDGANYAGSNSYALSVLGATAAMDGDQFQCIVSNALGSVTISPATLTVAPAGVSTLAGWPGWSGFADGQGSAGRFNYTGSVRVGPDGTIYVADAANNTVRKITPTGLVSTLAGSPGVAGSNDGPGSIARFNAPAGVAIDASGNVFVADAQNFTVRKITPAGVVSTFAGSAGVQGHSDGTGSAASFWDPEDLTIDAAGNLYIADGAGNSVRKITPAGVVTTLAGAAQSGTTNGTGSAARFNYLAGIAVDPAGNVYVGDYNNNAVRKITPAGVVTTLAGSAGTRAANIGFVDGTGTAARFNAPAGLAVDAAGNVFVADSSNNAIREITAAGVVTTVAGLANAPENIDGPLSVARFAGPADVAFDANGVLYVADSLNCTIRRIVFPSGVGPAIAAAPLTETVALGSTLALGVTASGPGPFTYQWSQNGVAIPGATASTFTVSGVSAAAAGSYTVAVTNASGAATSAPATITTSSTGASRLTNLSVRTVAGTGAQTLIVGFVVNGTPGKTLLVRGIGPGLAAFGLTGLLADPALSILGPNSSTLVAANNDNWNLTDASTMSAVGAFPLTTGSLDSAVVATLGAGNYSAVVTGNGGGTGLALAEIYDTAPSATTGARLINLSTRAQVGTGGGVLIAGFTITGNVAKTVLIRGVGPGLAVAPFNVTGTLTDPRLDVYNASSTLVQSNDDWSGLAALTAAFAQAGAFALPGATSKDAALLITLPPGSYTAQVSGVNGTTGVALIEIYEISP
jgi:sugar lactone lactonase YvrE